MVAGNSSKYSPTVFDNFGMGQIEFALGIAENHRVARLQTEPGSEAVFDK